MKPTETEIARLTKIRDWLTKRIDKKSDAQTTLSILVRKANQHRIHK